MMRRLYQLNRSVPTADEYAEMLEIEEKWLGARVAELTASASQTIRPTSVRPPPLSPQWAPPARKPGAS